MPDQRADRRSAGPACGQRRSDADRREDCRSKPRGQTKAETLEGLVPRALLIGLVDLDPALLGLVDHSRVEVVRGTELFIDLSDALQVSFRVANVVVGRHEHIEHVGIFFRHGFLLSRTSASEERSPRAALFAAVLEGRRGAHLLFGCAGKAQPVLGQMALRRWNRDVVRAYSEEASGADDRVRNGALWCDDDILDLPDLFVFVVVNGLAEQLLLRAPSLYDV